MTNERQTDLLALAKRAHAGEREAVEEVRVRVAKVRHPGQVKMLWVEIDPECGCREICLACRFGEKGHEHRHDDAILWPCAPAMVGQRSGGESPILKPCPDWPADIAAAFELGEEAKRRDFHMEFWDALWRMTKPDRGETKQGPGFVMRQTAAHCFRCIQAGPIERCAAFLMACGGEEEK